MEVANVNAWTPRPKSAQTNNAKPAIAMPENRFFFGLRDLTSDYYQVLIQSERPSWCRIIWSFIIFGLLLFTGFVVYLMVSDFMSYGSYDSYTTVTNNNSLVLPAITICSLNFINYTMMLEDMGADSIMIKQLNTLLHKVAEAG